MSTQPEALRLADAMTAQVEVGGGDLTELEEAATELRRLHAENERLTTRTISQVAKDSLRAIGLDEKAYTAHSLRHTTAVNILRAGGSIETAQLTLRHSNPATTQIYTATLDEERRLQNSG